jgi:hypothetical protein
MGSSRSSSSSSKEFSAAEQAQDGRGRNMVGNRQAMARGCYLVCWHQWFSFSRTAQFKCKTQRTATEGRVGVVGSRRGRQHS